jgi:putative ABC transport system permease protein
MLAQWLLLAFGVLVLSWPIAAILAKALVAKVLPASFGWSMPLVLDVAPFAISSISGLLILLPALTIPLYKLNMRAKLS